MDKWNPWKVTALAMALVMATALVTGLVVANWSGSSLDVAQPASAPASARLVQQPKPIGARPAPSQTVQAIPSAPAIPTREVVDACNRAPRRRSASRTRPRKSSRTPRSEPLSARPWALRAARSLVAARARARVPRSAASWAPAAARSTGSTRTGGTTRNTGARIRAACSRAGTRGNGRPSSEDVGTLGGEESAMKLLVSILAAVMAPGPPARAADDTKVKAATEQVQTGARKTATVSARASRKPPRAWATRSSARSTAATIKDFRRSSSSPLRAGAPNRSAPSAWRTSSSLARETSKSRIPPMLFLSCSLSCD